jgi:hypothetical protein
MYKTCPVKFMQTMRWYQGLHRNNHTQAGSKTYNHAIALAARQTLKCEESTATCHPELRLFIPLDPYIRSKQTFRYLHFECLSQSAAALMSHSLIVPLLLLYTNRLHSTGWNSAAVITSVSSSIFVGLMSTISKVTNQGIYLTYGMRHIKWPKWTKNVTIFPIPS